MLIDKCVPQRSLKALFYLPIEDNFSVYFYAVLLCVFAENCLEIKNDTKITKYKHLH